MIWQCHKSSQLIILNEWKILLNSMNISYKNYDQKSDKGYFLEVDVQYTEKIHELHNDLSLLPERMKTEKVEKAEKACS